MAFARSTQYRQHTLLAQEAQAILKQRALEFEDSAREELLTDVRTLGHEEDHEREKKQATSMGMSRRRSRSRPKSRIADANNEKEPQGKDCRQLKPSELDALIARLYSPTTSPQRSDHKRASGAVSSGKADLTMTPSLHPKSVEPAHDTTTRQNRIERLYERGVSNLRAVKQEREIDESGHDKLPSHPDHLQHPPTPSNGGVLKHNSIIDADPPSKHQQSNRSAVSKVDPEHTYRKTHTWKDERKRSLERARRERDSEAMAECTFQPHVDNAIPRDALDHRRSRPKSNGRSCSPNDRSNDAYSVWPSSSSATTSPSDQHYTSASMQQVPKAKGQKEQQQWQRPKKAESDKPSSPAPSSAAIAQERKHIERMDAGRDMKRKQQERLSQWNGSKWSSRTTQPDAAPRCATPSKTRSESTTPERSSPATPTPQSSTSKSQNSTPLKGEHKGDQNLSEASASVLDAARRYGVAA